MIKTMKKITLTCKDSGKFFHDCDDCKYYDSCNYFDKNKQQWADMKKRNLTNKKIRKASTLELIFRMNCLHTENDRRPEDAGIPLTDIWEANAIVKELRRRLGRLGIVYAMLKEDKNE